MATLYCTFVKKTGWRVFGCESGTDRKIRVVSYNGQRCLSIPVEEATRRGYFCNPKKLALSFIRSQPKSFYLAANEAVGCSCSQVGFPAFNVLHQTVAYQNYLH